MRLSEISELPFMSDVPQLAASVLRLRNIAARLLLGPRSPVSTLPGGRGASASPDGQREQLEMPLRAKHVPKVRAAHGRHALKATDRNRRTRRTAPGDKIVSASTTKGNK